jgi:ATP-binding cassette subfamily C protein LapB
MSEKTIEKEALLWEDKGIKLHTEEDHLLSCIVWFTHHFHRPFSATALISGLPLVEHKLTPPLVIRAAERAGLVAKIKSQPLRKLSASVFPALLMLKEEKAVVLLQIKGDTAEVLDPDFDMGMSEVPLISLEENYSGYMVLVKPAYQFSARSSEAMTETKEIAPKNWFWRVIGKVWPLYIEVLLASFLVNMFALAVPLFIMNVYDRVVPNQAMATLWVLALGVIAVFLFDFLMRILRSYFIDVAGKSVDIRLSAQIFEQILGIRMSARPNSVGAFANTIQSFESFRDFITSSTVTVLVDLPFVFIFIGIIALIGGSLALVPLIMVPLVILIGWLIQIPLTALTEKSYRYANEKQATLIEALGGVETIKTIGAESPMQRRWEHVTQLSAHLGIKLRLFANLNIYFSIAAQQFAYIFVIIWGVYKIAEGEMTTGGLIACSILTSRALAPMSQVAALLTRYYQSSHSLSSLNKVMGLPVERPEGQTFLHRPHLHGAIEFRQVNFQYTPGSLPALKNISLKISPGEHVGIIGRIGSGKTTIAKLILGLYQPTSGMLLLDGADQNQMDLSELRRRIGYIPQDVVLFYGSIKDNIVFGAPHVDDAAILRAADIAGVTAFTQTHPQGLDLQVGERGAFLSGGQRQSIAIARAFLLDPPVFILDEPTNAMDDKTEVLLKQLLMKHFQNKTVVLVTHKSSLLTLVERLIIIEGGQVVADGPKEEVIKALAEGKIRAPQGSAGAGQ